MQVIVTAVCLGQRADFTGQGETTEQAEGDAQRKIYEYFGHHHLARLTDWRLVEELT